MKRTLITLAGALLALGLASPPALARHSGGHQHGHHATQPPQTGASGGTAPAGVVRQVTLTNPGDRPLHGIHIQFSGKDSADFSERDTCGNRLGGGSSCTIEVTFAPRTAGSKSATMVVSSSGGTESVALAGTGL